MKYSKELGNKICEATATSSIGLQRICENLNVPYATVIGWIFDQEHELYNSYMQAKRQQLYLLAEEVAIIADEISNDHKEGVKKKMVQNKETVARSRLRIQARIAIITKLAPILFPEKRGKIRHKVIMPPPPERNLTPEQPNAPTEEHGDATSPSPSECPQDRSVARGERSTSPSPSECPQDRSVARGERSTPPSPSECPQDRSVARGERSTSPSPSECPQDRSAARGERFTPPAGLTHAQWDRIRNSTDGSSPKTAPKRLPNGDVEWIGENGHRYVSKRVEAPYCSRYY